MRYRKLGRWGARLSVVGLGSWLTYGSTVEQAAARKCIQKAYELGVNFFDTANVYANGKSEETLAPILAEFPRDSIFLATKVYFPMGTGPNDRGLSRKHIYGQIHRSLRKLNVE